VLPETGGASLLALGAGVLLVAGGLVARRILR
jgi:LPXTG-motif cell wall-anchored protein